ncbi:MAG: SusC/RagA family TonB-linked outer membrane protein [Pedobacter sp.]|uniref:SusC/RagA family TonB-linked outer membrane protein n=1 Tax=Pedobacter sp. TaxID=1411316 RepID=UPI00356A74D2
MKNNYKRTMWGLKYFVQGIFIFAFLCMSSARAERVQREVLKAVSLENYLKKIESAYKVSFVYDATQISKSMSIDAPEKLISIRSDLEPLEAKGITYSIIGKQVILKKVSVSATNKDLIIKGRVTSSKDKEPVPGVSVKEKNVVNGVSTDGNGYYQIKVKEGATLVFSAIGYKQREVPIAGRISIDVSLEEDVSQLKEVMISTGYQELNKKLFTGSSTKIKAVDAERSGIQDVSRMLEGQVAGVSVQNVSGTFGAAPKIRIRGASSLNGDNKPLWVVDGIMLEDLVNISNEQLSSGDAATLIGSSVAGLNPDDIESFEILRDAAATAMYGARAMNGVVVVTTKKGKNTEGKAVISYSGNFTTYLKPNYNQFDIMNSADQMQVYLDMENKGWLRHSDVSRSENGGVYRKMYDLMYDYDPVTGQFGLRNDAPSRLQFLNRYANANTDWFDVLFRNSLMQDHSISISSGTAKSKFYASTSFLHDNGWTVADGVKRFTGMLRGNFDITDRLQVEILSQGSIRDQRSPGTVNKEDNTVLGQVDRDFDINPFNYALNTSRTLTPYDVYGNKEYFVQNYAPFNILQELENNSIKTTLIDLKIQGGLKYKIIDGLKYAFTGAYRYVKSDREHSITEYSNAANAYRAYYNSNVIENNKFLYKDPSKPGSLPSIVLPGGGFYNVTSNGLVNYFMRHDLEYDKIFKEDHYLNILGVVEMRSNDRQDRFSNGVGYQFDNGGIPFINSDYYKQAIEANSYPYGMGMAYERFLSYAIKAAYSYKGKYSFNATGRYDGSNLLGDSPTARWLPTWNVSGAWNLHEEDFFKKQDVLNRATIRATYGLTASTANAKNSSMILRNQTTRRTDDIDKEPSIYIDGLENSELTWEKTYDTNLGFDLGFLKNRFSVSIDLYNRNGFDLIGLFPTAGIGGEGLKNANYADMKSKGIEFTLNAKVIDRDIFKWSTNLNFGYHKGKITRLDYDPTIFQLVTPTGGSRLGYPQSGLFSIVFDGLDHDTGVPTFIDETGQGKSTDVYFQSNELRYLKYEGQVDPKITGGFSNKFTYKDFTLSALVTFSAGNKVRLNPNFSDSYTDLTATSKDFLSRWTKPGDEQFTNVPAIADKFVVGNFGGTERPYNAYNYSSVRVADGGFARLKQVMLFYQLPKAWSSVIGATNASVGLVGNNVWLIYSDKRLNGQDPEFFGSGGVAMPIPRQYTLSLKVGF